MSKKLVSLFLIILICTCNFDNVYAKDDNKLDNLNSAQSYLISKGYPEKVISILPEQEVIEFANAIEEDPENNSLSWGIMEVNNLEELQAIANFDDDELLQCGLTSDEISKAREEFDKLSDMTDEKLQKEFNMSPQETNVMRKALQKNDFYKRKKIDNKATISGSISTSEMIYTQRVGLISTTKPSYNVSVNYEWLKPYYMELFDDIIAFSWGGNLNFTHGSSSNAYYYVYGIAPAYNWGPYQKHTEWSNVQTPNVGVIYSSPQSASASRMKYGHISFNVAQNQFQGSNSSVVSQYGHKTIAIGGGGVSLGGPSVSLGYAYDTFSQASNSIRY